MSVIITTLSKYTLTTSTAINVETQELFQYTTRVNPESRRFTLQTGNEKQMTRHISIVVASKYATTPLNSDKIILHNE
jgi:hypothetical protein